MNLRGFQDRLIRGVKIARISTIKDIIQLMNKILSEAHRDMIIIARVINQAKLHVLSVEN